MYFIIDKIPKALYTFLDEISSFSLDIFSDYSGTFDIAFDRIPLAERTLLKWSNTNSFNSIIDAQNN